MHEASDLLDKDRKGVAPIVFSSSVFLLAFLPTFLVLYFLMPSRALKNGLLFAASLVFYAWGEPVYIGLMVASVLINWLLGLFVGKKAASGRSAMANVLFVCDLAINLALLGFFKYEAFLAQNLNALLGTAIPELSLSLPIGISFYTLQAVSYIIDVRRGEVPPQRNPIYLGMYIAMFPQLVAGPIVRYATIQDQILNRHETLKGFCSGIRLFCVGLGKKVLLSNVCAILSTNMLDLGAAKIGVVGAWGGLVAYTFQILFDFSGYSDMAIGLGKMLGFSYLRNFNYPYISKSASEFWRRWHISLSSFFRDYVYIPLGGSRVKTSRWVLNIAAVWLLTGIWHGAAWNYVLWGAYYGCLLVIEKLLLGRWLEKLPGALQHLYAIIVFTFGWLVFWIEDLGDLWRYFLALLGRYGISGSSTLWELGVWEYLPVFLLCAIASTPIVPWLRAKLISWGTGAELRNFLDTDLPHPKHLSTDGLCELDPVAAGVPHGPKRAVIEAVGLIADLALMALLVLSVVSVVSGSFNPFIYFRF